MLIDASQKDVIRVAMIQDNSLVDYESEKIFMQKNGVCKFWRKHYP